ncbi:hypothetical protein AOLI_G00096260 [Acnodon oligacanthus]
MKQETDGQNSIISRPPPFDFLTEIPEGRVYFNKTNNVTVYLQGDAIPVAGEFGRDSACHGLDPKRSPLRLCP